MVELFDLLEQYQKLKEEDKLLIRTNTKFIHLEKGEYFLEAGKRCGRIGIVTSGILRTFFYDNDGKEFTKYFIKREQIVTNLQSFNENSLSSNYIQAETDCELIVITKAAIKIFSEQIENWNITAKRIIESKLLAKVTLKSDMLNQDASTRYLQFMKEHPDIIKNVPLSHIASYLGITQFSLSRIRKNILQQHFLSNDKN